MAKSKLVALALAAAITFSATAARAGLPMAPPVILNNSSAPAGIYGLMGCVAGIMLAAIDASRRFNRELTGAEAASCGLLYWINFPLRP